MSATTWMIIAIVGFSLAGIALIAAVFMFIKMNIPAVIGDLTGKTVAREIKAIRNAEKSDGSTNKNPDFTGLNMQSTEITGNSYDKVVAHASRRLDKQEIGQPAQDGYSNGRSDKTRTTEPLIYNEESSDTEKRGRTAILPTSRETAVLPDSEIPVSAKTELLPEAMQAEAYADNDFAEEHNGTAILSEAEEFVEDTVKPVAFKITRSVIHIHTDEVI